MTKRAIDRSDDIMALHEALRARLDTDILVESLETRARKTFEEISTREGLEAAIAWRDSPFPTAGTGG